MTASLVYFPAVIRSEHESPIDALVALGVPREECMDMVAASWCAGVGAESCLLTEVDGGRAVAVLPLAAGRWAACNAYPEQGCGDPREAARRLARLLKRGRRGLVGVWGGGAAGTMGG